MFLIVLRGTTYAHKQSCHFFFSSSSAFIFPLLISPTLLTMQRACDEVPSSPHRTLLMFLILGISADVPKAAKPRNSNMLLFTLGPHCILYIRRGSFPLPQSMQCFEFWAAKVPHGTQLECPLGTQIKRAVSPYSMKHFSYCDKNKYEVYPLNQLSAQHVDYGHALYSGSLKFNMYNKFYTHWTVIIHFLFPLALGNHHSTIWVWQI